MELTRRDPALREKSTSSQRENEVQFSGGQAPRVSLGRFSKGRFLAEDPSLLNHRGPHENSKKGQAPSQNDRAKSWSVSEGKGKLLKAGDSGINGTGRGDTCHGEGGTLALRGGWVESGDGRGGTGKGVVWMA